MQPPPRLLAESRYPTSHWAHRGLGRWMTATTREPGDLPRSDATNRRWDGKETRMTTLIKSGLRVDADARAILATVILGAALIWTAGFANSAALHGAAHDSRHAIAFPCD